MVIHWTNLKRTVAELLTYRKRHFLVVLIGLIGFLISVISLTSMHIGNNFTDIPTDEFFFLQTTPFVYWIGIGLLVLSILSVCYLKGKAIKWGVLLSGLLIISMRIILNMSLTNPLNYDQMVYHAPQITSWLQNGFFSNPNPYAHDWPLSFAVAYFFTKAGIPVNVFFSWAAIPIYLIDAFLAYSVARIILNKKEAFLAVFLFGLICLQQEGGLITLTYLPQLVGGTFYLLSLYLTLRLATGRVMNKKTLVLVCSSIFLMILSHHLTVIYFILTLFGLSLISKIKESRFHNLNFRIFSFLTIFTSVTWIAYSFIIYPARVAEWINALLSIVLKGREYPNTFNSLGLQAFLKLPLLDAISFIIVPIFIGTLFLISIVKIWHNSSNGLKRPRIFSWLFHDRAAFLTLGMVSPLAALCILGLALNGLLYPIRIIEFALFLLCPLGSEALTNLLYSKSRKIRILIIILVIIVTLLSIFWMYKIVQRTVPQLTDWLKNPSHALS